MISDSALLADEIVDRERDFSSPGLCNPDRAPGPDGIERSSARYSRETGVAL
jgi:hypothetical protein